MKNDDQTYRIIGGNICRARQNAGYSQTELAELLGINRVSLTMIETGRTRATVALIYQLAELLACSLNDLLPPILKEPTVKPRVVVVTIDDIPVVVSAKLRRKILTESELSL